MIDGGGQLNAREELNSYEFQCFSQSFGNLMSRLADGESPLVNFRQNSRVLPSSNRLRYQEPSSHLGHVTSREESTAGLVWGY